MIVDRPATSACDDRHQRAPLPNWYSRQNASRAVPGASPWPARCREARTKQLCPAGTGKCCIWTTCHHPLALCLDNSVIRWSATPVTIAFRRADRV